MSESSPEVGSTDTVEHEYASPFPGTKGRPKSLYLDMQERVEGEQIRAVAEGREPDLSDVSQLPATVGTPLVLKEQVPDNVYANPTQQYTELQQEKTPEVLVTAEVLVVDENASPANDGNAEVVNEDGESSATNESGDPDGSEDETADGQTNLFDSNSTY